VQAMCIRQRSTRAVTCRGLPDEEKEEEEEEEKEEEEKEEEGGEEEEEADWLGWAS
jgi:hypothetical protein